MNAFLYTLLSSAVFDAVALTALLAAVFRVLARPLTRVSAHVRARHASGSARRPFRQIRAKLISEGYVSES